MTNVEAEIKNIINKAKEEGEVLELNLEGVKFTRFTPNMRKDIEALKDLEVMILIDCGLETLEGFPKLNLHAIDISRNNLNDDSNLNVLAQHTNLTQIFAVNNKIERIETVMELKNLPSLVQIDFGENPVSENPEYRKTIFENFPQISIVDAKDKDGKQVQNEEEFEDDEDDEEDEYEAEDDSDQFEEEDEEYEEESEEKPKRGRKRKN